MTVSALRRVRTPVSLAASAAIRPVLEAPRRPARVLAVFPAGAYLEVRTELEPSVIAVLTGEATRLPNSVLLTVPLPHLTVGDEAGVGDGSIELGPLSLRVRRWWDPAPPPGQTDLVRLARAVPDLAPDGSQGLAGNGTVDRLAQSCRRGWLLGALTSAEQLVGLGPGLTPSGDDVLCGLLVTLRHLGRAARVPRAMWLADWLAPTVTFDARTRTTPLSATLLHCAAAGAASPEVSGVLRGLTGRAPLEAAVRRLRAVGHTSGADLAQGISIGLDSVLELSGSAA
ncbi:DUF2877 domain-containing protein [Nonomuraea sp. NPDC050310]|uniref:DUF2877 domain-containing protein n=1 Tax=unclassified Nonomuraea TaxID=2593643 RepID=UPI0033E7B5B9